MSCLRSYCRPHFLPNCVYITKTNLYNFDPFIPHFYTVKLGFTGVYIIFLTRSSAQKRRLWVLVRTASSTHNPCFEQKYEKYQLALAPYRIPCEDSDQTARKHRLIWVFAERKFHLVENAVPRLISFIAAHFFYQSLELMWRHSNHVQIKRDCCIF